MTLPPRSRSRAPGVSRPITLAGCLIRSPLCCGACATPGVAELGELEVYPDCVNRTIVCRTCGVTGVESVSRSTDGR